MNAMSNQANMQHNKLMKLDGTMLMYRIYSAETLEKLINTVHEIHNVTSSREKIICRGTQSISIQDAIHGCLRHTAICN